MNHSERFGRVRDGAQRAGLICGKIIPTQNGCQTLIGVKAEFSDTASVIKTIRDALAAEVVRMDAKFAAKKPGKEKVLQEQES